MEKNNKILRIPEGRKTVTAKMIERYKDTLEEVYIPSSVKVIKQQAFEGCEKLKIVEIADGVEEIEFAAFRNCKGIEKIRIPKTIKEMGNASFCGCESLKELDIEEGATFKGFSVFRECNSLVYVTIPGSIEKISLSLFEGCKNLLKIELNEGVKSIDADAFRSCESLKEVVIPDTLEKIEESAFSDCSALEEIKIPDSVKIIEKYAFSNCDDLKRVDLGQGVEELHSCVFTRRNNLEELNIPKSVKKIDYLVIDNKFPYFYEAKNYNKDIEKSFWYTSRVLMCMFRHWYLIDWSRNDRESKRYTEFVNGAKLKFEDKTIQLEGVKKYSATKYGFMCELENGDIIYPSDKGEFRKINREILEEKTNKFNQLEKLSFEHIYKMEKWGKYDSVPSYVVVKQMPYEEIDLFYKNNNKTNWQKLIKASQFEEADQKGSLFALAHALGVFSENGAESKEATEFILNEILPDYTGEQIHSAVGGFDVDNTLYNPEYAKFFMHNFNGFDFMVTKINKMDNMGIEEVDLLVSSHNNFKVVQKLFPEKKVITRQDRDRLTPELVKDVLSKIIYENVDERAEELADKAGRLGYNQEQFDKLQEWYLIGLDINKQNLSIVCEKDNEDEPITYEVLEKDDPLGAVIGTLTNCCQVVGGAGQECVEYGMTQPNSTFIAFRQGERLVGQAWVWYDKDTKQVTLDNIEVPDSVMNDLKAPKNQHLKEAYLECINRLGVNLVKSMNENFKDKGQEDRVERVTIGLGWNDFAKLLKNRYGKTKQPLGLTGYSGYSDATKEDGQVTIVELQKEKTILQDKDNFAE